MSRFRTVSNLNDPPPPYSTRSSSPSLSSSPVAHNPLIQLRRYIIEIIGFTFDADFSLLNQALGQTVSATSTSSTNSILTPDERAELLDPVTLIKELEAKISDSGTQWLTIRSSDREAVAPQPQTWAGIVYGGLFAILSFIWDEDIRSHFVSDLHLKMGQGCEAVGGGQNCSL